MMRRVLVTGLIALCALTAAAAQENAPDATKRPQADAPPPPPRQAPQVPLKVQIVLTRMQGDKKLSSLPFTLGVVSGPNRTNLRLGVEVPISSGAFRSGGVDAVTSYSYKNIGTNIDCGADALGDGLYRLVITVEDSSVQLSTKQGGQPVVNDVPSFRSFKSNFSILLRDGQTQQYTSATDPVSGEVMKIDVGLSVVK